MNFITAHDGFTLKDLVSYNDKHNEANGEANKDGHSHNISWNHGVEGPTDDPEIRRLRRRQMRNLLATVLLSRGTPMILAGDEFGRTQNGNNNAYAQDNEISWLDWEGIDDDGWDMRDFTQHLIEIRQRQPLFHRGRFLTGAFNEELGIKDVTWFDPSASEMDAGSMERPQRPLRADAARRPGPANRDPSEGVRSDPAAHVQRASRSRPVHLSRKSRDGSGSFLSRPASCSVSFPIWSSDRFTNLKGVRLPFGRSNRFRNRLGKQSSFNGDDRMTTPDSTEKIEKRAHQLWEAEGCPEGRELEFWLHAERELSEAPEAAPAGGNNNTNSE